MGEGTEIHKNNKREGIRNEALKTATVAIQVKNGQNISNNDPSINKDSLWVNFMARCGQKSDLSGLCGIGYWVWSIST